ncbi:MAG: hypothetical protein ACLQBA_11420 [Candidatus Binataceae bacterium]
MPNHIELICPAIERTWTEAIHQNISDCNDALLLLEGVIIFFSLPVSVFSEFFPRQRRTYSSEENVVRLTLYDALLAIYKIAREFELPLLPTRNPRLRVLGESVTSLAVTASWIRASSAAQI